MNLIELSVKRPIATGVIYVFVCGAGILSWNRLPQEVMPDLNFPQLTVVTDYPQAAPQEIENLVTKPVEEAVGTVKNVRQVRSISKEGSSVVTIEFSWGTDMDFASLNVREKLDLVKSRLPSDVKEPTVIKFNPFLTPVMILSLHARSNADPGFLSKIAQGTIANKLQKVEGVAAVNVSGAREEEIHIDLDQNRLAASRVSVLQFLQGLTQANYRGAAGTAKDDTYDYSVRVVTPFESVPEIERAVVAVDNPVRSNSPARGRGVSDDRERQRVLKGDQRLIPVSNLARVSEGFKERTSFSRFDGADNITIMIHKQASAATTKVADQLKKTVEDLNSLLPSEVTLSVVYNQGVIIKKGIADVLGSVIGGGVLAFITLYLFLGNWRDALIVSTIIPTSTLATIVFMNLMGISLNTISLGGLALGVGMLVDAAICVTENIHRWRQELGKPAQEAAVKGTKEVVAAIISSNLTSIAVFLPLLFVMGLMGQLFRDLSLTVTISQVVSIVVAMTLVPMLAVVMASPMGEVLSTQGVLQKSVQAVNALFEKFHTHYLAVLTWAFDSPRKLWAGIGAMFIGGLLLLGLLPKEFLPHVDAAQLVLKLTMPNGTRLDRTDEITRLLENKIGSVKEVLHRTVSVGSASDSGLRLLDKNQSQILMDLDPQRKISSDKVLENLRGLFGEIDLKGGRVELSGAGGPLSFAQSNSAAIMLHMKGSDLEKLAQTSDHFIQQLAAVPGIVRARGSFALPAPEITMDINKDRAARLGLTVSDIGQTAMVAYNGKEATRIHRDGKEIPVLVRLREEDRNDPRQLRSLLLPSGAGFTIPLQDVAHLQIGEGPSQIDRLDQERMVLILADTTGNFSSASKNQLKKILGGFSSPGITLEEAGEKKAQKDSFISLGFVLVVAVLLVYMVMAIQFESLLQPFLILVTIPLSLIGMSVGLFITGKTLNAVAGMGLLLLAGIVVNNGIVLLDFVNAGGPEKGSLKDALVEACQTRLRPILLTAVSTVAGLVPLALGIGEGAELQSPMAITIIFGLAVSTVLTLVALPVLYHLVVGRGKPT